MKREDASAGTLCVPDFLAVPHATGGTESSGRTMDGLVTEAAGRTVPRPAPYAPYTPRNTTPDQHLVSVYVQYYH